MSKETGQTGSTGKDGMPEWQLAHLAQAVRGSDDAIVSKTLEGIITSWNPAAETIFGYTAEEAVGSPISIIIPSEYAKEEPEILARLQRGEKVDHHETVRIRRDGRLIHVCLTICPIRDSSGKIVGATKIAREITSRKRIEEQIHLEQDRLQATLTSIGDGVIVTDVRGCVEFLNPVAEALTGWTQEEGRGKALETVFNIVNESSRQRVESPVAKAMREGISVGLANHTLLITRTGTEVAIDDSAAPIRNGNGTIGGVVLVFRDVTSLRAAENVRARLSAIVEGSFDAIIGKDLDGRITSWNNSAEKIFGYNQQEAIGRPVTMLIPPERLGEEADILRRIRAGERVEHYETVRLTKDRRRITVSLTISPIYDGEGKVIGASKIARDISEKKKAERELADAHDQLRRYAQDLERLVSERTAELTESLEELETFSSGLSHDLKGPLRSIESHARIIFDEHGTDLPAEARQSLRTVIDRCGQLRRFVDNVLAYARLRSGGISLEDVELDSLVQRVLEEYPHAKQAHAEVTLQRPLLSVHAHEDLLTQVLANLISNGVKFVPAGTTPRLNIWTEPIESKVRLWVEDNGIGIAEADQDRVFSLFTRLHSSAAYEGTGIGLALVYRAVRRMGGRVGVKSTSGQGSRFWVELSAAGQRGDNALRPGVDTPIRDRQQQMA